MSTIADVQMTPSYIRRLDREKYVALVISLCLALAGLLGMLFHLGPPDYPDFVSNFMYPLTSFVGASWAFFTAYRGRQSLLRLAPQHQLAWLLVGLALFANCAGGLYYTYLERSGQTILVPSFSDVGFTLFYPLIFMGLFLLPTALRFRLRVALDALITTLSILGVSWFFFISKVFVASVEAHVSIPEFITVLSYPFWDMLLLLALLLLIYRRSSALPFLSFLLLGLGILSNIWADTGYAYSVAIGVYDSVNFLIDPFWYLGFLLVGVSSLFQYAAMARSAQHENGKLTQSTLAISPIPVDVVGAANTITERRLYWYLTRNTLIYLPLAILLALALYSEYSELVYDEKSSFFLMVLTALVGGLVAVRSLIATYENDRLLNALAKAKEEQELHATELSNLYTALQVAHERLQGLDKLKDQFIVTASHELRTPLTSVQGYLDLLVTYDQLEAEQQRTFILKAQRSCDELVLLLNNVMDVSRLEIDAGIRSASLQAVAVNELVQGVINIIEPQVTVQGRQLELRIPAALSVRADSGRLRQVLLNLVVNAMKYSPTGSPIILSAMSVHEPSSSVILSVIDKGNGVTLHDQKRLFQRFVRLERDLNSEVRGSGLGLYISRRLVEAMGGEIWVESSGIAGEGSSFNVRLPLAES